MPRIETPKHRIQRAFPPLIFRTPFKLEPLLTPPLPWHITFSPHADGKPADDAPLVDGGPSAIRTPLTKMKRPLGEPGRKGERGFVVKSSLDLPEGMYEELLDEVHSLAASHLELTTTITHQSQDKLDAVCQELKDKFPILEERFEGDWPAKAIIQSFLKNTSAKSSTKRSK